MKVGEHEQDVALLFEGSRLGATRDTVHGVGGRHHCELHGGFCRCGGRLSCSGNDNTPAPCAGGGILMDSGAGRLTVVNSVFINNKTIDHGGGLYNYFGLLEIRGSTVSGNEATQGGGIDNNGGILTV